jgi:hypothetical protein
VLAVAVVVVTTVLRVVQVVTEAEVTALVLRLREALQLPTPVEVAVLVLAQPVCQVFLAVPALLFSNTLPKKLLLSVQALPLRQPRLAHTR